MLSKMFMLFFLQSKIKCFKENIPGFFLDIVDFNGSQQIEGPNGSFQWVLHDPSCGITVLSSQMLIFQNELKFYIQMFILHKLCNAHARLNALCNHCGKAMGC